MSTAATVAAMEPAKKQPNRMLEANFRTEMMGEFTILANKWGLQAIPQALLEKKKVKVIVVSRNCNTTLPPEIGGLMSLTVLKLDKNRIRTLPAEIGNLQTLTELSLADNLLNNLPVALGAITGLKKLVLNGNPMMERLPGSTNKLWEVWASRETEDALSARVRPGGKSPSVSPAGSSTSRADHGSIPVAAEEPPSGTPATLDDHDERNRRRFWKRCSLIGGAVIGVAVVALKGCK
ncbi:hypothetical protein BSKO_02545 [Bryopsis sp. KO-2023]|nr:hypothetical protein BSKO_02545 [Bryopsis sp. KO-2023]